jgi:hypothetical protein
MKNVLMALAGVGLGVVLGRVSAGLTGAAEAGGGPGGGAGVAGNGDVNGSGVIDISDASYLLNHLFLGGPALVPCSGAIGSFGLPDTGQTRCYDQQGDDSDCATGCRGQDGFFATGCQNEDRFVDNGDGTVTDNCTGLMWQQHPHDADGDGSFACDADDALWWCAATTTCFNLRYAGYDDWRLPNIIELQSIVNYGSLTSLEFSPLRTRDCGPDQSVYLYWSSTSWPSTTSFFSANAFRVNFHHGDVSPVSKNDLMFFRAVRDAR